MISKKLNQILKIGIFILITISSFLIFPKIGYGCTVKKNLQCGTLLGPSGPLYGCGFNREGDNSWVCGIKMTPDSYYCSDTWSSSTVNECPNADVWFKQDACPDTNLHNGETCVFADGSRQPLAVHCYSKDGNWNGADKACVQCEPGKPTRAKLLAEGSTRCFNLTDTTWEEYACANDSAGKCDYGCGADLECNHAENGVEVAVPGGICNNCVFVRPCSWQDDNCGSPCSEKEMHQTCGPAGCVGTCDGQPPGSTRCIYSLTCDCEATCSCKCPVKDGEEICPCALGTCPPELRGGLVPCGRGCNDPCTKECECCPCTLCHLFVLFKRIVDFLTLNVLFPLAVLMIVVGGVMFLTAAGDPGRIGTAKKILTSVVIGLLIIFLAWLIVDTIIMFITESGSPFRNWSTINCPICGNGDCESGETSENCPDDCGAPPPVCTPSDGCDGICPAGCTVAEDPDCGCQGGNGCCGIGCNNASDSDCPAVCSPDGCNGVCPAGCTVAQDPDCGCLGGDSCCGIGCNNANDSDCPAVCTPDGCNGNCPAGCTVAEDPDCGCQGGNGCCGIGCSHVTDPDCPLPGCPPCIICP